jgi:hypothetical protein
MNGDKRQTIRTAIFARGALEAPGVEIARVTSIRIYLKSKHADMRRRLPGALDIAWEFYTFGDIPRAGRKNRPWVASGRVSPINHPGVQHESILKFLKAYLSKA